MGDAAAADRPAADRSDQAAVADRAALSEKVERLCEAFAATAVARDRAGGTAKHERDLLRASGLLALVIPVGLGGLGRAWPETLSMVRRIAQVDGSLAHLFGFQHLMLATVRLFGTPAQWTRLAGETARRRLFWGNALNPLDARTTSVTVAGGRRVNGIKSFCSGASDSDMLILSAVQPGQTRLLIAAVASASPGIRILDDWDNMGQRQTDSGTVEIDDLFVDDGDVLDTPGPLGTPFASLRPCLAQLILANVYLGIAEGALQEARRFTQTQSRAWFASGVERPVDDPYVIMHYGNLTVELAGARALTDAAGSRLQEAWERGEALGPPERGEVALAVALAKVATTRAGLEVTNRLFEVAGARATSSKTGLDRFWRNLRTHTLHDPVDYKVRDLGRWSLTGELPTPSFYS
jgi:alkylation response protein AidB-like acyl-CoA dehydrogenase